MSTFQNFIAGSFRETGPRQTIEVKNPATGRVFASVTSATEADVIQAVDAAAVAQKTWGRLPAIERGELVCLLPELAPSPWELFIYRPQRGPVAPRVRLVYDHLIACFSAETAAIHPL